MTRIEKKLKEISELNNFKNVEIKVDREEVYFKFITIGCHKDWSDNFNLISNEINCSVKNGNHIKKIIVKNGDYQEEHCHEIKMKKL